MKRQIYVARGENPKEWSEVDLLGPFESEMKAREAIKEEMLEAVDGCEMLSPGRNDDFFESYHLFELIKSFRPIVDVSVELKLTNVK